MDDRLPVRAGLRPDRAPQRTASGPLPPRLLASWQRSQDYGVPLEEVEPVFTGTWDEQSLFFQCGREVLTDLHRTLVDQPVSLMLTDAEGLVLNRLSGDAALSAPWTPSTSRPASATPSGTPGRTVSVWRSPTGRPRSCGRTSTTP